MSDSYEISLNTTNFCLLEELQKGSEAYFKDSNQENAKGDALARNKRHLAEANSKENSPAQQSQFLEKDPWLNFTDGRNDTQAIGLIATVLFGSPTNGTEFAGGAFKSGVFQDSEICSVFSAQLGKSGKQSTGFEYMRVILSPAPAALVVSFFLQSFQNSISLINIMKFSLALFSIILTSVYALVEDGHLDTPGSVDTCSETTLHYTNFPLDAPLKLSMVKATGDRTHQLQNWGTFSPLPTAAPDQRFNSNGVPTTKLPIFFSCSFFASTAAQIVFMKSSFAILAITATFVRALSVADGHLDTPGPSTSGVDTCAVTYLGYYNFPVNTQLTLSMVSAEGDRTEQLQSMGSAWPKVDSKWGKYHLHLTALLVSCTDKSLKPAGHRVAFKVFDGKGSPLLTANFNILKNCKSATQTTKKVSTTKSTKSISTPTKTQDLSKDPKNWKIITPSSINVCYGDITLTTFGSTKNLPLGVKMSGAIIDSSGKTLVDRTLYSLSEQSIQLKYIINAEYTSNKKNVRIKLYETNSKSMSYLSDSFSTTGAC
ncbi:hypothetical protein T439DRAFT_334203 [Meredithblackwellia eburnea MCA 4105]